MESAAARESPEILTSEASEGLSALRSDGGEARWSFPFTAERSATAAKSAHRRTGQYTDVGCEISILRMIV